MKKNIFFIFAFILIVFVRCEPAVNLPLIQTNLPPDSDGVVRDLTEERRSAEWQSMQQKGDSSLGLGTLYNRFKGLVLIGLNSEICELTTPMFRTPHFPLPPYL